MKKNLFLLCFQILGVFADTLLEESFEYPQVCVEKEILCDVELILNKGFSPLEGFLDEKDYHSVLENLHLVDGSLWPIPIVFPMTKEKALELKEIGHFTLIDEYSLPIAICDISEVYAPDVEKECLAIYGSLDDNHPIIQKILNRKDALYIAGKLRKINLPVYFDFREWRLTPDEVKAHIQKKGWKKVVGFQTRNPLHRCHVELIKRCLKKAGKDAKLLLHPTVGTTQPGDVKASTRVKCYEKLLRYFDEDQILLSLLPLSMRMAGPREALWHALIRRNYGCTHFIVGRDHAGPSVKKKNGEPYFDAYAAHRLLNRYNEELGITILTDEEIVYDPALGKYVSRSEISPDASQMISGTQFRRMLLNNEEIPEWFSYPEIIDLLRQEYNAEKGVCIYFVGLSGSGKTALTQGLKNYLESKQDKPVIVLDGDIIRKFLSNNLDFSRQGRSLNVRRIGFAASLIVECGGICLCANIAPFEDDRMANRELISKSGSYIEVFVDTPLEICEKRDVKGLYKAARAGKISNFTGVSDPFERPQHAEIVIDSSEDLDATFKALLEQLEIHMPKIFGNIRQKQN